MISFRRCRSVVFRSLLLSGLALMVAGCFHDPDSPADTYREWKDRNEQYVSEAELRTDDNGNPYFEKIVPSWAPNTFVLVHWHNDRALTENNLSPMDNSTTQIKYQLLDIDGKELSNSYSAADSVYTSKPSSNIIGMWTALTHMNVGDSVTMVIPSSAGYGELNYSGITPYSTLIYNVKFKAIKAYEVP